MSDLVGNPEDRFSRVTAHMRKQKSPRCDAGEFGVTTKNSAAILFAKRIFIKN